MGRTQDERAGELEHVTIVATYIRDREHLEDGGSAQCGREVNLKKASLGRAQLQGADLEGAQLQGAKLEEAQLEEADLSRTNFEGATGLTAESVENACYQPKTGDEYWDQFLARGPPINLPDGITIPPCKKAKEKNEAGKK